MSRPKPHPPLSALLLLLGATFGCAGGEPAQYFDLAGAFARAAIHDTTAEPPQADGATDLLFLPAGSAVSFSFEGHPSSSLRTARVALRGAATRLEIHIATDESPELFETRVDRTERELVIDLPTASAGAMTLTLRVDSERREPGDGVLLTGATVWGVAPEPSLDSPVAFDRVERPNVVIYLIDTLRRDRLGSYGYDRPLSPRIDEFARGATLFENSVGQSSWTKASVASMWSGVWPPSHGATGWAHRLPERYETVAERLRDAGYQTAAFVTNLNASPAFGLDQGFDHMWFEMKRRSDLVNEQVIAWLEAERDATQPLFLYVHTMDPHAGYNPTEPFRTNFAPSADEMKPWKPRWRWPIENLPFFNDLYDGEIAQNDDAFGNLIRALKERGLFDSSLIIALSDHGEEFREHGGWRHGRVLHYGSLDVPLIVKLPHQEQGSRSSIPASHVDILPTVLDVAGLPPSDGEGQSLVAPRSRPVFSHLRLGRAPLQYSVFDGRWKLIQVHREPLRTLLYDLREDPGETNDLAAALPVRTALLEGLLRERLAQGPGDAADEIELTEDLQRSLRALGYLQ